MTSSSEVLSPSCNYQMWFFPLYQLLVIVCVILQNFHFYLFLLQHAHCGNNAQNTREVTRFAAAHLSGISSKHVVIE